MSPHPPRASPPHQPAGRVGVTTASPATGNDQPWLAGTIARWYTENARDLPWRRPGATAWHVLVSEFMLQQTPVVRVLPVYGQWVERWPTPGDLARESPGEAVRAWGRLGYPRRALRLHAAAVSCVNDHDGQVPSSEADLLRLPGVGSYTAAAVAAFAFAQRTAVLDTNVRRVLARLLDAQRYERPGAPTRAERERAFSLLPVEPRAAAATSAALMELGAVVCTSRAPDCPACPVSGRCRWRADGYPPWHGPLRRAQSYAGTDRQCRGRLLAVLRASHGPVPRRTLEEAWPEAAQRERALDGLVFDGLVEVVVDEPASVSAPADAPAAASDAQSATHFRLPVSPRPGVD